ncbi:hypothetical protein AXF42_Ash019142 [Apostasia shenzhenica]|uniref:DUF7086 domain-containing protein n=1 Tax=Apostasia shenzhenica TaxID=1088818 RepID=A0A2I0B2D4_9ASPA|nr:hypothetical protein AXF42_Ash019142 [Apostasia shenzhenica]
MKRKVLEITVAEAEEELPVTWRALRSPLECRRCGSLNSLERVVLAARSEIVWLFLLVGRMMGCGCLSTGELRYFCRMNGSYVEGDRDELLLRTYMIIFQQLDPGLSCQ